MDLDPHQKPPESLRHLFKRYQKASQQELDNDVDIVDLTKLPTEQLDTTALDRVTCMPMENVKDAFAAYLNTHSSAQARQADISNDQCQVEAYKLKSLPGMSSAHPFSEDLPLTTSGLILLPSLIPGEVQLQLLERVFHRDLSTPDHKTNVHFHHDLVYPEEGKSFFDYDVLAGDKVIPKDNSTHKPITMKQFFGKKLRWMTLGGQYDWTDKKYPDERPPEFPQDLKRLLGQLFPSTKAEAAIVNLYAPGDVLSMHRDVAEFCDNGLISLSIGCDAIFLLCSGVQPAEEAAPPVAIRLHSGDVVYMTGESRFAWHGVPRILKGTCPPELQHWPGLASACGKTNVGGSESWQDWLAMKRININVRQMFSPKPNGGVSHLAT